MQSIKLAHHISILIINVKAQIHLFAVYKLW